MTKGIASSNFLASGRGSFGGTEQVKVAFPPALLAKVDKVAHAESHTRSSLIREALRRYIQLFEEKEGKIDD